LVGGLVNQGVYLVITGFGPVPGIGDFFVAAGVDFVHEEVDFCPVELAAGDAAHFVNHIFSHRVYLIKSLKISSGEPAGALSADVDIVVERDFNGKGMGGFAGMIAVGAGAVDLPVEACSAGFVAEDAFGEGTAADVAEADQEDATRWRGDAL